MLCTSALECFSRLQPRRRRWGVQWTSMFNREESSCDSVIQILLHMYVGLRSPEEGGSERRRRPVGVRVQS
ncbi:hypothetical protein GYMLUDRAFT_613194 [Collybiopsis luxurians FD-317 M1]|uniref:Uncharacterized protein n=1 Tax=Collybiopsis luxurians FD-317 M1 TaxID=944289 RepID=A0A0D0BWW7_9AGAR|nr:hypothetical protein GYMLUDRAFT_613194 [Collybiopsis luxurians FD-317 M1]